MPRSQIRSKDSADTVRVRHMLDAIDEAILFVKGKNRENLENDRMLTLALLKELELIGEAASKVTEPFRSKHPNVPWTTIIATRNRLIHGYFDVDLDIVWGTIQLDLPILRKALKDILS